MALRSPCEGISRVEIFERDYIAAHAADMPFDRIERHTMAGVLCLEILWFSQDFLTVDDFDFPKVGYLPGLSPQAAHVTINRPMVFGCGHCRFFPYRIAQATDISFPYRGLDVPTGDA